MPSSTQPPPCAGDGAPWPRPVRAWLTVLLLLAAYVVSSIDRTILLLLVEPIKASLALSDLQIALVGGLAFGIFYAVMGLPLGWVVDTRRRLTLIAAGLAFWSLATAACGLAAGFASLFAARMAVGLGEAVLSPAAMSLISDLFPPERRALPISVFVTAAAIGGGLAMIVGGSLIGWVEQADLRWLPVSAEVEPWRLLFVLVGLPGLVLAAVTVVLSEPARRDATVADRPPLLPYLRAHAGALAPVIGSMTTLAAVSYGYVAWIPTFFIREFGWTATAVGQRFGVVMMVGGVAGSITGGLIVNRLRGRGWTHANLTVVASGLALMTLPAVAAPLVADPWAALILFGGVMFFTAVPSGAAVAALQDATPNRLRGRVTAVYYATMSLVGVSAGPALIAVLARPDAAGSQAAGMALMAGLGLPLAAGAAWLGCRRQAGRDPGSDGHR